MWVLWIIGCRGRLSAYPRHSYPTRSRLLQLNLNGGLLLGNGKTAGPSLKRELEDAPILICILGSHLLLASLRVTCRVLVLIVILLLVGVSTYSLGVDIVGMSRKVGSAIFFHHLDVRWL